MSFVTFATLLLRFALAASFLSAVADRFGYWGSAGTPNVAWGNFQAFTEFTGTLLPFLPANAVLGAAWTATVLEVILAVGLILGFKLRLIAFASGLLILSFAITMTMALGAEAPLSYSVWTAAAASFLLATLPNEKVTNDKT
jgi:uncharacterized membrane protein YphA (DoxX/SURF4 family)